MTIGAGIAVVGIWVGIGMVALSRTMPTYLFGLTFGVASSTTLIIVIYGQ